MANNGSLNFEIPAEMREFAEKSVKQAKQAFDGYIAATQQAAGTVETQAKTMQSGAREAGQMAMSFAERNVAASFEFAQRLMQVRDAKEVTALQAEFIKKQIETLTDQAKEMSQQAAKIAGSGTGH